MNSSFNDFCIAISTVGDAVYNIESIIDDVIELKPEVIVCHQLLGKADTEDYIKYRDQLHKKYSFIKFIVDPGKGLSRSRNLILCVAQSQLIFISDDDNEFCASGIHQMCSLMFEEKLDIGLGRIKTPEGDDFKTYTSGVSPVSIKNAGSVSSLEMCVNRKLVADHNLRFDEDFGLGTPFPSCEEFIFITDALKLKAKIQRADIYINIHPMESSGKNFANRNINRAKGAAFARVFGIWGFFVVIAFAVKKCFFEDAGYKLFRTVIYNQMAGFFYFLCK